MDIINYILYLNLMNVSYRNKYLKYKKKYIDLKKN
jgi:hypothetical protein